MAARPYGDAAATVTILRVALWPLSASELAGKPTLFASFMGDEGRRYKTIGQLRAIYRERSLELATADDGDHSLRVDRFMNDMVSDRWQDSVVVQLGVFEDTVFVIDGVHRGIAYLGCIEAGVSPERLPALHVDR